MALFKKYKISTPLFIVASLATLILFILFTFLLKINLNYNSETNQNSTNKYYFKGLKKSDPLITKISGFNDMLAGPIINSTDPSTGSDRALITIIEFSDFECEFCKEQEKVFRALLEQYSGKIKIIWKDYPENDIESISFQAAVAARCANEQNQFWNYHDLLYQNNEKLEPKKFLELADQLNLNKRKFQQCLDDDEIKNLIRENIIEANALSINGIPFVYIDSQELMGQISLAEAQKIIEEKLKKLDVK